MTLSDLLPAIPVTKVEGRLDVDVTSISVDSRRVAPGTLFVALSGLKVDGHQFVPDAIARGAVAVLSEKPRPALDVTWIQAPEPRRAAGRLAARLSGEPSARLKLVGVTGTNGKTTTAYLVHGVFQALAPPSMMMGTVVDRIGEKDEPAQFTTPESPDVQAFLSRAVAAGSRFGVMEVSSHGLALERLEGTWFDVGVFTNLTRDHLDFHRDMEQYFAAKRRLFTHHLKSLGSAVVGIDDAFGRRLAETLTAPATTYGFAADASLRVSAANASFDGLEVEFVESGRRRRLESPLVGRHNALNLMAAYGALRLLGFEDDALLDVLRHLKGAPGRFEKIEAGQPFQVIVDYAHTDDALRNVLEAVRALPHERILTVFGCGGDRDRTKRPLMGAVASRLSNLVVLTSDNPRSEDPLAIIREIELGTKEPLAIAEVCVEPDRRKAIELACSLAGPGDVVVI